MIIVLTLCFVFVACVIGILFYVGLFEDNAAAIVLGIMGAVLLAFLGFIRDREVESSHRDKVMRMMAMGELKNPYRCYSSKETGRIIIEPKEVKK